MLWLIFGLSFGLIGAIESETAESLNFTIPDTCPEFSEMEPHLTEEIPKECCHFSTKECHFDHNGMCRLSWDVQHCDYTVDACGKDQNKWFCTCCASCTPRDGNGQETECAANGGICRKACYSDEFPGTWDKCASKHCQCCKKKLIIDCSDMECSSGSGICVSGNELCPPGFTEDPNAVCPNDKCKCCKEISRPCCETPCFNGDTRRCVDVMDECPPGTKPVSTINCGTKCKCCEPFDQDDYCNQKSCSGGLGTCMRGPKCSDDHYPASNQDCKGKDCICCIQCRENEECKQNNGYCGYNCPYGATRCPECETPCICCNNGQEISSGSGRINVKNSNQMEVQFIPGK